MDLLNLHLIPERQREIKNYGNYNNTNIGRRNNLFRMPLRMGLESEDSIVKGEIHYR